MLVEGNDDARYVVVFDPLDGSSNIDASIPTGMALVLRSLDSLSVAVRTTPTRHSQTTGRLYDTKDVRDQGAPRIPVL